MKNACRINSDGSVSILLNSKYGLLEAVVTKEHYEKYAEPFAGTWIVYKHPRTGKYYARGTHRDPGTNKLIQPMLHRLIANPGKGEITAHINHNTLDCRPENMFNMPIGADLEAAIAAHKALEAALENHKEKAPAAEVIATEPAAKEKADEEFTMIPLKGVSFHKGKGKWEASVFHEGTRYRLGYWPPDRLYDANTAVETFRKIGPEAYFTLHPKKGKAGNV